jgi:hypothetical protein
MKVGFTGTRAGLSMHQDEQFKRWMRANTPDEFHHGECSGADEQAVWEATRYSAVRVVAHPCHYAAMRGRTIVGLSAETHPAKPPLARNRDIVDACDVLLACPDGPERLRSGTWSTVRFARRQGVRVVIFWPDGTTTEEPRA